ncbi:uncharacterized protein LOC130047555 [Ostrea edulis]|uniref:uncharacterized protein LOC130047555 n=1 Tax=Ostrea edulis TaxID=37623 RepID=UPI0024AF9F35|nr:uncharacterized protein LOC130047555 [Ostrea edulis]
MDGDLEGSFFSTLYRWLDSEVPARLGISIFSFIDGWTPRFPLAWGFRYSALWMVGLRGSRSPGDFHIQLYRWLDSEVPARLGISIFSCIDGWTPRFPLAWGFPYSAVSMVGLRGSRSPGDFHIQLYRWLDSEVPARLVISIFSCIDGWTPRFPLAW